MNRLTGVLKGKSDDHIRKILEILAGVGDASPMDAVVALLAKGKELPQDLLGSVIGAVLPADGVGSAGPRGPGGKGGRFGWEGWPSWRGRGR